MKWSFVNNNRLVPSILPESFLASLEAMPGFDRKAFEAIHGSGEKVISVRSNPAKWPTPICLPADFHDQISQVKAHFQDQAVSGVPWSAYGYYLSQRPHFTLDPIYHGGAYYVQEASSMFLELALRQGSDLSKPLKVLDLCAAPGGKSTHIQSLISKESLLVSNEAIKGRTSMLLENITKWGASNVIISNNDPTAFGQLEHFFDIVVIDAPCSGSGLFRREPLSVSEWKNEVVKACSLRQQRILADIWPSLKPGGLLIYSTCSYSAEENESNLDWILEKFDSISIGLTLPVGIGIVESKSPHRSGSGYRFYPDKIRGEGFYLACIRKAEGATANRLKGSKSSIQRATNKDKEIIGRYLRSENPMFLFSIQDLFFAIPESMTQDLASLKKYLYLKKSGIVIGRMAGKELIPHHELALSEALDNEIQRITLSKEQAIQYLRKDDFDLNVDAKGWTLVTFDHINLGWIKLLGSRFNNYYPLEWRIKKRVEQ